MNAIYVLSLLSLVCLATATEELIGGEDVCRFHKDGTVLLKPGFCDRGIKCMNFKSEDIPTPICSGTLPYFNPKTSKCVMAVQFSVCNPKKKVCTQKSPTFINDPYNCDGWFACASGKTVNQGKCPENTYFNVDKQMCTYKSETTCTAKYEICDVTPPQVQFQNPKNCSEYFVCQESVSKLQANSQKAEPCGEEKFYDPKTGECVPSALKVCDAIPVPFAVCGTEKLAIRGRFVSDRATCRGYFYCKDLGSGKPDQSPNYGQCDETTFFNESWEACIDRAYTKCNRDRCDGHKTGMELSETFGCQHYYECQNNLTINGPIKCADNMYFDEYKRQCVTTKTSYNVCT